jgi:hypothetical protein
MLRTFDRMLFAVIGALTLALVALLAGLVDAGPLDPNGPPTPTMKTLDEIPGSWSRTLPANDGAPGPDPHAGCNSSRFQCVFGNDAVLDRETGLVWQRSPTTFAASWIVAGSFCEGAETGGRSGWRLPSMEEIRSLADPSAGSEPFLPPGHPFADVQPNQDYWTANSGSATIARTFGFGLSGGSADKSLTRIYWCVRGGSGFDGSGFDGP